MFDVTDLARGDVPLEDSENSPDYGLRMNFDVAAVGCGDVGQKVRSRRTSRILEHSPRS